MCVGVERAGHAQRHQPGLLRRLGGERLELLEGAGGHHLAGTVVVGGGQAVLVDGGEHLVAVAAEHGGHAGRGDRGRLGHRPAALADQHHRLLGGDDPRTGGRGQLADAVAGDGADLAEGVGRVREDVERGDQAGGHQQRLGDLGVPDRVGVGLGAVVHQVERGHGGQPLEAGPEGRLLEPGGEEPGGLGALTGRDDDEHTPTVPNNRVRPRLGRPRKRPRRLCRVPTKDGRMWPCPA